VVVGFWVVWVLTLFPPFEQVTGKSFKFPEQHELPFFFVSAADGTNVVKVFEEAVEEAVRYRFSLLCRSIEFNVASLCVIILSLSRDKVAAMVEKGEFDEGVMGGGDMQFMAEVTEQTNERNIIIVEWTATS
jgi:hypothetical protein